MELHKYKKLNFGFGILSPDQNVGAILCTMRSIRNNFPGTSTICAVTRNTSPITVKEIAAMCPVYKGKDTITSLMNTALRRGHKEWNLLVMEGAIVRPGIIQKFSLFVEEETDVLFPIVMEYNREGKPSVIKNTFPEASLNGTFIHQKLFKLAGDFSDKESIIDSKLWWAGQAMSAGAKFKAVLGTKLL
jgi:hypothetical protein